MSPVLRLEKDLILCLLLFLLSAGLIQGQERRNRLDDEQALIATASQCIAQTINYITHSHPQSCSTSAWPNPASTSPDPPVTSRSQEASGQTASWVTASEAGALSPPAAATAPPTSASTWTSTATIHDEANGDAVATPFLSFEDWKEVMLRRAGQDPQELRQRKASEPRASHRAPHEFADSALGEEGEISLVFDNYHDDGSGSAQARTNTENGNTGGDMETTLLPDDDRTIRRSQDAGKTCKERFSYSSFDAGATILKTGRGTKNAKAILVENQDSYMLLECATQNKFIIVELSDDILIDTIVIANFEFFSSMIRHFRVSVSDRYPVKMDKWRDLGIFEARNSRDIQPFLVQNPQIWAKYLRLEFITHYGNEYFCPVSLLRVHGSRMLDSWKDSETGQEDAARDEDADLNLLQQNHLVDAAVFPPQFGRVGSNLSELVASTQLWSDRFAQDFFHQLNATCAASATARTGSQPGGSDALPSDHTSMVQLSPSLDFGESAGASSAGSPHIETIQLRDGGSPQQKKNLASASHEYQQVAAADSSNSVGVGSGAPSRTTSSGATRTGSTASASSASPTVQEGFFNAITKRLQQVETNLTLSLKYVEDQSRHIQDALKRAESKQITRLTVFLSELNQTVLTELHKMQDQYDQMWQSTVLTLESQREQSERDIVALSTRLNVLADEVVFQKRMAILQAVLLLSCLFLVIFSRGSSMAQPSPSHGQVGFSSYPTASSAYPEHNSRLVPASEDSPMSKICEAGDRYLAIRCSSEESQYTMGLLEPHDAVQRQDLLAQTKPKVSAGSETQQTENTFIHKDLQGTCSHRSASKKAHCNTTKPLPSLPEYPLPTDES